MFLKGLSENGKIYFKKALRPGTSFGRYSQNLITPIKITKILIDK
jgi:hypothetical protein